MGMKANSNHFGREKAGGESTRTGKNPSIEYNPWESDPFYKELQNSGNKFTKENVKFVTKDKSGQLIWLETGDDKSGLTHIVSRHKNDFYNLHHVSEQNIMTHIHEIVENGNIEYSNAVIRNGNSGFEKLYNYNNQYYLLAAIGNNGYIVTAYPITEKAANIYMRRNKQ